MQYKYKGKTYHLQLNDDGKITSYTEEFGTIEGTTAEEVQAKIRKEFDAAHDSKKRIKILTFGEHHWGGADETKYFEGQTTGIFDHSQTWVTWKDEDGDPQRAKMNTREFCLDTPDNRTRLDSIIEMRKEIERISDQVNILIDQLVTLEKE